MEDKPAGRSDARVDVDWFFEKMVENGAGVMILKTGSRPTFRIDGSIIKVDMDPLSPEQTQRFADKLVPEEELEEVLDGREFDGSYSLEGVGRFRLNVFLQRGSLGIVAKYIETEILGFDELNLPPQVKDLTSVERGLALITGKTSSGKSTTLAAIVDYINETMKKHVVTIEDPIEFLHADKKSIITQREIGPDTRDYSSAVKYVLRQDPDVILFGELRDQETFDAALSAAQTGHLVFSTLHTNTAAQSIERLNGMLPPDQREQKRSMLADSLVGVCTQRLIPKKGGGLIPAVELMFPSPTIEKLIVEMRTDDIRSAIHQGRSEGMQTIDQAIVDLYKEGLITEKQAQRHCTKPANFKMYKEGRYPDISTGVLSQSLG